MVCAGRIIDGVQDGLIALAVAHSAVSLTGGGFVALWLSGVLLTLRGATGARGSGTTLG